MTDEEVLLQSEDANNYLRIGYSESEADDETQNNGHLEYRRDEIFFTNIQLPEWRGTRYLKNPAGFASSRDLFLLLRKGEGQPISNTRIKELMEQGATKSRKKPYIHVLEGNILRSVPEGKTLLKTKGHNNFKVKNIIHNLNEGSQAVMITKVKN